MSAKPVLLACVARKRKFSANVGGSTVFARGDRVHPGDLAGVRLVTSKCLTIGPQGGTGVEQDAYGPDVAEVGGPTQVDPDRGPGAAEFVVGLPAVQERQRADVGTVLRRLTRI